jgi:hypothetical protein
MALTLSHLLYNAPISMDDGSLKCVANHDATFALAAETPSDWVICMEDDAQPVAWFYEQAEAALRMSPAPMVSMYFGYLGVRDEGSMRSFEQDTHWILRRALANTVCTCVHRSIYDRFIAAAHEQDPLIPCDLRYERAGIAVGVEWFAYTNPSLVEHADVRTVHDTGADVIERKAYVVGTRPFWNKSTMKLPDGTIERDPQ